MNLNSSSAGQRNTDHTLVPADSSDILVDISYLSKIDTQPGRPEKIMDTCTMQYKPCGKQLLYKKI